MPNTAMPLPCMHTTCRRGLYPAKERCRSPPSEQLSALCGFSKQNCSNHSAPKTLSATTAPAWINDTDVGSPTSCLVAGTSCRLTVHPLAGLAGEPGQFCWPAPDHLWPPGLSHAPCALPLLCALFCGCSPLGCKESRSSLRGPPALEYLDLCTSTTCASDWAAYQQVEQGD